MRTEIDAEHACAGLSRTYILAMKTYILPRLTLFLRAGAHGAWYLTL